MRTHRAAELRNFVTWSRLSRKLARCLYAARRAFQSLGPSIKLFVPVSPMGRLLLCLSCYCSQSCERVQRIHHTLETCITYTFFVVCGYSVALESCKNGESEHCCPGRIKLKCLFRDQVTVLLLMLYVLNS